MGRNMEQTRLQAAADTLGQLAQNFASMPTEKERAAEAGLYLVLAQAILTELAMHLSRGLDHYEAMEATARGELKFPDSAATVLRLMAAKPES